jgi:ABC-type proline/glycine betaine transport system permease subunit
MLVSDFLPNINVAFVLALLCLVSGIGTKRVVITLSIFMTMFLFQTESGLAVIMAPTARWLGLSQWQIPWVAQLSLKKVQSLLGGKTAVALVEGVNHNDAVKRR